METKIYKDIRNRANRAANCDAANAGKMLKAAAQQLPFQGTVPDSEARIAFR